jgi:hypothetical protein
MARFKIVGARWKKPDLEFIVRPLAGAIPAEFSFRLWHTDTRYEYDVVAVSEEGHHTVLLCRSKILGFSQDLPAELWESMFAGKEVDTDDPTVALRYAYSTCMASAARRRPWWRFWA